MLRRRWWLFALPFFVGTLGGLLYSRSQPSLYRSDAVVQVVPQRIPESYVQSTVTERVEDRLNALAQQVLSRTQLETVILEFNLYPEERRTRPMEDVFEMMTADVQIAPLQGQGTSTNARNAPVEAFRISFDYPDPKIAQTVTQKLAGFFIDRNASERGFQADLTSQFLEAQLADARGRLEAQEKKLETFREQNSGRLPTQTQTNMQAIQNTQMALQAMVESLARDRDRRLVLDRLYSDATAEEPVASAQSQTTPGDPAEVSGGTPQQRLEAARSLLAQLQLRLTPVHPDILRAKRQITELERLVAADEAARPLSPESTGPPPATPEEARRRDRLRQMSAELESLERQIAFKEGEEKRLREQVGQYQARLEAVPGIESEWVALTRDYDTLQATYRELLGKSENSKMAASLEQRQIGEQFRILDPPRVPLKPYSPDRPRINAMGAAAGFGLGLLLLGFTEYRDATMRTELEVASALDLP
ncbi:MAG: GumC family protein, partial [Vicinamibacterales bacterium]